MKQWINKTGLSIRNRIRKFAENNAGVGIIEVILILVILIAVVLIFKNQITDIINEAFNAINNDSSDIIK